MQGLDLQAFVQTSLAEFNTNYPRPAMQRLVASKPFDLLLDWNGGVYPNSDLPGVYLLFDEAGVLLYIGKASCNECIGSRLGKHFGYSEDRQSGVAKCEEFKSVRYIVTVGIQEKGRAFEAPAIEEYLIGTLRPRINHNGKCE
jgi:hypothetical protein